MAWKRASTGRGSMPPQITSFEPHARPPESFRKPRQGNLIFSVRYHRSGMRGGMRCRPTTGSSPGSSRKVARSFRQHLCRRPWRRGADQPHVAVLRRPKRASGLSARLQLWAFRWNGPTIRHGPPGWTDCLGEPPRSGRPGTAHLGTFAREGPAAHRAADTVTSRLQPADAQVAIDRAEGRASLRLAAGRPVLRQPDGRLSLFVLRVRVVMRRPRWDRMGGRAV